MLDCAAGAGMWDGDEVVAVDALGRCRWPPARQGAADQRPRVPGARSIGGSLFAALAPDVAACGGRSRTGRARRRHLSCLVGGRRRHQRQELAVAPARRRSRPPPCAAPRRHVLRHADRFVLPLLRGDLFHFHTRDGYRNDSDGMYLADAAADHGMDQDIRVCNPDGMYLADAAADHGMDQDIRVCNPATGRSQAVSLPDPSPAAGVHDSGEYVLLIGDGLTCTGALLSCHSNAAAYLQVQTFSPQHHCSD
ncbi:hypothetical protein PVAP13_1NG413919 [Panicum virgatum]|uniref:Uncharacterized protein n=1 Tax=Panicum virgatum TaxID=38727 RepID=A0A8T0X529_PANVG|nr:hypothetical protein PVAP13_1NG413919 [Panicum virgatum]